MAKLSTVSVLPTTYKFYNITSKLQKTASNIGFIKKALYKKVRPKLAQINGQLLISKINLMQNKS